eukprot:jgi/Astpho2/6203/gw1.00088.117.1_t
MRLWAANDLQHIKTIEVGKAWVTDCLYLPSARRLICTSADRAISFYDLSRSTCDISGRMHARGAMGMPLCLGTAWSAQSEQEQIIYGDDAGAVI